MKRKIRNGFKRTMAAVLSLAMLMTSVSAQGFSRDTVSAKEKEPYNYLPVATMPEEISSENTFYVGTTSADLKENEENPYLLQIGRGGDASGASSVVLKITDATAAYGKDYKVRLHDGDKTEADCPEGNRSLLDIISQSNVLEDVQLSDEEQQADIEKSQENLMKVLQDMQSESEEESKAELVSNSDNPLTRAKENLTGTKSDRQDFISTNATLVDGLSDIGNSITGSLWGSNLKVDFAAGEKTKYVELVTIDNEESDGNRLFYLTLSEPGEGMTNSAVSESMFTIRDDEPEQEAEVSFARKEITVDSGVSSVEVVLTRTGNISENVMVHMTSKAGSAVSGQNFAPVDADVLFPFGVKERKLTIAVDSGNSNKDMDFELAIEKGAGAVTGSIDKTKVILKKETNKQTEDRQSDNKSDKKKGEVTAQVSLSDVKEGKSINIGNAYHKIRGDTNAWIDNDGDLKIYAGGDGGGHYLDVAIALSGDRNNAIRQYVYDGFKINWKKSSDKPNYSEQNLTYYRQNETSDARVFYSAETERWGWCWDTYYFANTDAAEIKIYLKKRKAGKPSNIYVRELKPILRPFIVKMETPAALKFVKSDGTESADTACVKSRLGDVLSGNDYAIKYGGDKITVYAEGGMGDKKSKLIGVDIISTKDNDNSSRRIASRFLNGFNPGDRSVDITLNNDFCTEYANYIKYEGNGGDRRRGRITVKPVYSHVDCKVTINKNTELVGDNGYYSGEVYINKKKVADGVHTYHCGDILDISAAETSGNFVPQDIQLDYYSSSEKKNVTDKTSNSGTPGKRTLCLRENSYSITPQFMENNNHIAVRIYKKDKERLEEEGILSEEYFKQDEKGNSRVKEVGDWYEIEVVKNDELAQFAGERIPLVVTPKEGYTVLWKETNNNNYYLGNTLYYEAKSTFSKNVIYLYPIKDGDCLDVYLTGKLYYENRTLLNAGTAGDPIIPAKGGFVCMYDQVVMADDTGKVESEVFKVPSYEDVCVDGDTKTIHIKDNVCVRVLAGADGAEEYKDINVYPKRIEVIKKNGFKISYPKLVANLYNPINRKGLIAPWIDYPSPVEYLIEKEYKIENYDEEKKACRIDFSNIQINTLQGVYTHFDSISCVNDGAVCDFVKVNGQATQLSVSVTQEGNERATAVEFLIMDGKTHKEKSRISASYDLDSGNWIASKVFKADGSESKQYEAGDRVFAVLTTNRSSISDAKKKALKLTDEQAKVFKKTIYAPVNTGYILRKEDTNKEPIAQSLDMGVQEGLSGIPLVGSFNTNLDLGLVSLKTTPLYDKDGNNTGTRMYVMMGSLVSKIVTKKALGDETAGKIINSKSDTEQNNTYGTDFISNFLAQGSAGFFDELGNTINKLDTDAMSALVDEGNPVSMGSPKWSILPTAGLYLDFAIKYDNKGQEMYNGKLVVNGGGVYLGITGKFSVAWYALMPVVYIPCYFGVAGELSFDMTAGLVTHSEYEEKAEDVNGFVTKSHNLKETLGGEFNFHAHGMIQIYVGVGVCGTLGVRGGATFDADFLTWPTNPLYHSTGIKGKITLGFWVDLLLFTLPIPVYTFGPKSLGLYEELEKLNKKYSNMTKEEMNKTIQNEIGKRSGDKKVAVQSFKTPKDKALDAFETGYQDTKISYQLKDRGDADAEWNGDMKQVSPDEVSTMATYREKNTHVLLADGYDRPDSQMADMGEYGTLLVFLQDDKNRPDEEQTAISYSVYKNGSYSEPVIIQTDGTADFQPSVTDAGDNMLITWVSSDKAENKGNVSDSEYQSKYVKSQEVYVVSVPKADLSQHKAIDQSAIVRLTNDNFYDSEPVAVYDDKSGDYNVYYVKTAEDDEETVEAVDLANPMNTSGKTYSVIAYRVYDNKNGKGWLVDEYAENEKPDNMSDEAYKAQLRELGGQRMLSSPIKSDDVNLEDPLIADLTAVGYEGKVAFSYSVDMDFNADTDDDREMFMQFYDFDTRSTYLPIRITNDMEADSQPQIVRRGNGDSGTTFLFWKHGDKLDYIDVSRLVKYGIDENGNIREEVIPDKNIADNDEAESDEKDDPNQYDGMSEDEIEKETYQFIINEVNAYGEAKNQYSSYSQYRVAMDKDDNIYIIWVDGDSMSGQEIYACAMIETETKEKDDETGIIKDWSRPNRLTNFNLYCDEPALAITEDGMMLMAFNKYDLVNENENGTEVPKIKDMELTASLLEPCGSMEATEVAVSDITPEKGQDVNVSVTFENTGLTAAKNGFKADIYEKAADGTKTLIDSYNYEYPLNATQVITNDFTYTANEKTSGSKIEVYVTENELDGTNVAESVEFVTQAEYSIVYNNGYQGDDSEFYCDVTVKNTGNIKSAKDDTLQIVFSGPYGTAWDYGLDSDVLASKVLELEPGESLTLTLPLNISADIMNYYGKIDAAAKVVNGNKEVSRNTIMSEVWMMQPAELVLNDGLETVELKEEDSLELKLDYVAYGSQNAVISPEYTVEDESVACIQNGELIPLSNGTTTVTARTAPYAATTSMKVIVSGMAEPGEAVELPTQEPGTTPQPTNWPKASASPQPGTTPEAALAKGKITSMISRNSGKLTVSWKKVNNAAGYEVTYARDKGFTNNKVVKTTKKQSITLNKLKNNKTYYVKVRAYYGDGNSKVYGAYSTKQYIDMSKRPSKVSSLKLTSGNKKIGVSIKKVKNAAGYEYILSNDKNGKKVLKKLKTKKLKVTFNKLKANKKYYVTVQAYKVNKGISYLYGAKVTDNVKTK